MIRYARVSKTSRVWMINPPNFMALYQERKNDNNLFETQAESCMIKVGGASQPSHRPTHGKGMKFELCCGRDTTKPKRRSERETERGMLCIDRRENQDSHLKP